MSDGQGVICIILGFLGFFGLVMCGAFYAESVSCARIAAMYGVEYSYGPLISCQMKMGGEWVPYNKYRGMESIQRK